MAEQLNKWKNRLYNAYLKDKKDPKFEGTLEKQRKHWNSFLEYKTSELAKQRSVNNKVNAAKRSITITRVLVATQVPSLSGMQLRPPSVKKGSLYLQRPGPVGQEIGYLAMGQSWT